MTEPKTICIAGFGLMGGSLGKAIQKYTGYTVFAVDRDPTVLAAAAAAGAAGQVGGAELLRETDLLILAMAPGAAEAFLREHADKLRPGAYVTDICGVKGTVVPVLEKIANDHGLYFLGGHPMAGKEHSGFEHADSELFQGAGYILTPTAQTPPEFTAFLMELAVKIGCRTVTVTDAAHHDAVIAYTSQLPHVLAGAYIKSPAARDHDGYSAGSFRDVSRVAAVDEQLWCELFLDNRENLSAEIGGLIARLTDYQQAIDADDAEKLRELIRTGKEAKLSLQK